MFKEPGESSPDRVSEKVERAAAASRSRIRRERTVREFQPHNPFAERGQIQVPDGPANDLFPRIRTRTRVHVRQDEEEEQRTSIESLSRDDWGVTRSVRYGNEDAVENSRRRQAGEELLRDALQYQRPGQRMRVPRSPRTSALRFEVAPAPRSSASPQPSVEEQALLARPSMPSPPYSFSDNSATGLRLRGIGGQSNIGSAERTPGFAPAQGVHRDNEERERLTRGTAPRHYTPPGESSWTASYEPLHRVGHTSPRPELHLSRYGGLGDRRRSVSSSSSDAWQDPWETLLTTMEPDATLPSTESSFTSATASQSTRQSRQSSQTQNTSFASTTAPTVRHLSRSASPAVPLLSPPQVSEMNLDIRSPQYACLSQESRASMRSMLGVVQNSRNLRASNPVPGATELHLRTDENFIIVNHFSTLRMMDAIRDSSAPRASPTTGTEHADSHRSSNAITDDNESERRQTLFLLRSQALQHQLMAHDMGYPASNMRPNTPPVTTSRRVARGAETLDPSQSGGHRIPDWQQAQYRNQTQDTTRDADNELEYMQGVIERMARREDIPDEWWAAAGLARTVRENQ
jgi:hypothetical protein